MNPLSKYKDTKVAILCKTEAEANRIGRYILELGGRIIHNNWNSYKENTCLGCNNISSQRNCYGSLDWHTGNNYEIIPSEQIQEEPHISYLYPIY